MRTSIALLLLLLVAGSSPAFATDDQWLEIRSPHFTVLTNASDREGRRTAGQFERMRGVFHSLFPTASLDAFAPLFVIALRDKKSFQALQPTEALAKGQIDLTGYFMRVPEKNYVLLRLDAQGEHPFAIVYHEYTHLLMSSVEDSLPLWLNEGFAEFYQNTDVQGSDVRLGQTSVYDILYLRDNSLLPLTTLLTVDHASPYYHEEKKGSMFYAESWALTHYLEIKDSEKGTHHLQDYIKLMSMHKDPVEAAQQAFGDLSLLQKALDLYVHQPVFQMFKMKTDLKVDEATFTVRPVAMADANATRADLMAYNGRTKEALTLLESTLREAPKNAMAHESMGHLRYQQGDEASARKWYAESIKLDPASYLAHYYYALTSIREGDAGAGGTAEASLQSAMKLNPRFAPAYDLLAKVYVSRHEMLAEAYKLTLKAVELEPDSLKFRMDLAVVLTNEQKFADAKRILRGALPLAKTDTNITSVQSQIARIESYEASLNLKEANAAAAPSMPVTSTTTMNGKTVARPEMAKTQEPHFATEKPTGVKHTAEGVLRGVKCFYPKVITLNVEHGKKTVMLYSNDMFKIGFTMANYTTTEEIDACNKIEGMKAKVEYAEVSDKSVGGQILAVELSR